MKKVFLSLLTLLLISLVFCFPGMAEETDAVSAGSQTYSIRLFSEPQSIRLPKAVTSYWFMVPEGAYVEAASLSVVLDTSDTLLEDYSTATLEVNGVAVASVNLQTVKKEEKNVWDVSIPVERLKTDGTLNQLSIITAKRSILGDCADIDNPANWLIISDESALMLSIRETGLCQLSNLYPFLFNRAELGNTVSASFVLGGSDPDAEAQAALTIASAIGANYPYKKLTAGIVSQTQPNADSCFVIDAASKEANAGEGLLSVAQLDGRVQVQVAGGNREGLEKAVGVLANSALLSQFSTQSAVIQSSVSPAGSALAAREDGFYTLADFEYDDLSLAGAFHQQANLSIRQPDGLLGGPGSYFEVHFRHSNALVSDTSLLTVCFDGVPTASIQLSRANADGGKLRVAIPRETLNKGIFDITVDVYNYLGKIDCSKDWDDVAWTVIEKDSVLYLEPGNNTVTPSLARFPSLWGQDTLVCLPADASETVLQAMAGLAARCGQNTRIAARYTVVHSLNSQNAQNSHIILAGSRDQIVLPSEIADALYVQPVQGGYKVREGVSTIPEALTDKIIIQAVRSPYNYKKNVYVILWADQSQEQALAALAGDADRLNALSGELALIGGGNLVTLNAAQEAETAIPLTPEVLMSRIVRATGIPRIGIILIFILILLILFLIIRQIRMRNRFSDAKTKMERQNEQKKEEKKDDDDFEEEE